MDNFIVLNLGHAHINNRWWNKDISSPFVRLFYVKSGNAVIHLADRDIELTAGHMYMISSYAPHSYECEVGFDFYYLFVYQNKQSHTSIFETYEFPYEVNANDGARLLFEHYCMLYPKLNLPTKDADAFSNHQAYIDYVHAYNEMEQYEQIQLHGMIEILLSYFVKHAKPRIIVSDSRIVALLNYIQQNIDKSISIEELADKACLTKSYLIRTFRQALGVTPLQYVIHKKIQRAQTLLLGSELSVQKVAEEVGMEDVSYFIRLFKKNIGFTPQEYRKKLIG